MPEYSKKEQSVAQVVPDDHAVAKQVINMIITPVAIAIGLTPLENWQLNKQLGGRPNPVPRKGFIGFFTIAFQGLNKTAIASFAKNFGMLTREPLERVVARVSDAEAEITLAPKFTTKLTAAGLVSLLDTALTSIPSALKVHEHLIRQRKAPEVKLSRADKILLGSVGFNSRLARNSANAAACIMLVPAIVEVMKAHTKHTEDKALVLAMLLAGATSGVVMTPLDLLAKEKVASAYKPMSVNKWTRFQSLSYSEIIQGLVRESGMAGLMRGALLNACRGSVAFSIMLAMQKPVEYVVNAVVSINNGRMLEEDEATLLFASCP